MENVTGQWRFRDGRPMVAAYRHNETVWAFSEHWCHCDVFDAWKFNTVPHAIMPVDPPKVWRPFRDLAEAFKVMGPNAYRKSSTETTWVYMRYWTPCDQLIDSLDMQRMFDDCEWTLDPSQTTGNRCGVEE